MPTRCDRRALLLMSMLAGLPCATMAQSNRPDLVVADFEGSDHGGWTAEGAAFGDAPSLGTLPGQMEVSGFEGKGLVNSYLGGDGATGTLTSPPFKIERKHLNFLIGGGQHPGAACMDLLVEGQVARTATGPNDRPGGTERLEAASWDVSELEGKTAVLRIVDRATGGWGHINIDQIVQSDTNRGLLDAKRELTANARYLHLPVDEQALLRRLRVSVDGQVVRELDIKLGGTEPDYHAFLDLEPFRGKAITIDARLPADHQGLAAISLSGEVPGAPGMYRETLRPQFHFTARRGWLNDPNGLVHHGGKYHLFFQHNPYGWDWGNMHWGHATSPDLVHWTEHPEALYPRQHGDWAFSGSAVVDRGNTSGFGTPDDPPIVLAYTSTGRGECIAYSRDDGQTWTEYEGNPVVKHAGRDPRLFWHAPTMRWVMAVYDETDGRRDVAFHTSPDLKEWTFASRIGDFFECPDVFALPLDGDPDRLVWVLHAADGKYLLGDFDGREFTPSIPEKLQLWHGNFYAAQTFSDVPDGRRIQVGWGQGITFPGMPFNQQMTLPVELELKSTAQGPRMHARPVRELRALRVRTTSDEPGELAAPKGASWPCPEFAEVELSLEPGPDQKLTIDLRGVRLEYDAAAQTLTCAQVKAPLALDPEGRVRLRLFLDRGSVEVFANHGELAVSSAARPVGGDPTLKLAPSKAGARIESLEIHELGSAWTAP